MFRRRSWLAVSVVSIIFGLYDPAASIVILRSEKSPKGVIIGRENRGAGREVVGKNTGTLAEGNDREIYENQVGPGSNQVSSASDTLGINVDPSGSGKSGIKGRLKNGDSHKLNDFYSNGLNINGEKVLDSSRAEATPDTGHANVKGKPSGARKKYAEHKWRINQVESSLNDAEVLAGRSFDREAVGSRLVTDEEDPKFNKREERALIQAVNNEGGSEGLRAKSSRDKKSEMVGEDDDDDDDETERRGGPGKKMQSVEGFGENKSDKETYAKARIVDGRRTTESFNDSEADTDSSINVVSESYRVSDNQRKVPGGDSTGLKLPGEKAGWLSEGKSKRVQRVRGEKHREKLGQNLEEKSRLLGNDLTKTEKNDDYSISPGVHEANINEGESSGPCSRCRDDELRTGDSHGAIKRIGKTKFNKKLPIGLSAVNYAGYIEAGGSDSNVELNPIPIQDQTEESYRRADVARDMSHEGHSAVPVANELACPDAAEIPESVVRKMGANDAGGTGFSPVDQSGYREVGEKSNSQLIKGGLSGNRGNDSTEVIGGNGHVLRKLPSKIAAVSRSEEANEHLGIIETANGGGEGKSVNEDKGRNEMTTTSNITVVVTAGNTFSDSGDEEMKIEEEEEVNGSSDVSGEEESLSKGMRISNFLANQRDGNLEITRPPKTETLKRESRGYGNDTDEFQSIVGNPGSIQADKMERIEDVEGATIDVGAKSSGNLLLSGVRRDEKVVRIPKFILQNLEKLEEAVKIDNNRVIEERPEGNTPGYPEIDVNTSQGWTATTGPSARIGITNGLSLTFDPLDGGEKNEAESGGEVNRGGVSRRIGKKKANMLYKLWGSKPEVVNLSALDISGYGSGYLTERIYFDVDRENNDRAKLPGEIATRSEYAVVGREEEEEEETFSKLDSPEVAGRKFLVDRLSDKYLASKDKRAAKSSAIEMGDKIIGETIGDEETTASFIPLEFGAGDHVSVEKIFIGVNKSETSTETGSIFYPSKATGGSLEKKFRVNNTRLFSRSFRGANAPAGTTSKISGQSAQLFPVNGDEDDDDDGEQLVFFPTTENSYQFDNSTEMNALSEMESQIFGAGYNLATEDPAVTPDSRTIAAGNQTYENIASRKFPDALTPASTDSEYQDILQPTSYPREIPSRTTLQDTLEAISLQSSNTPFSFNQTDLENTSRISTALNQWPVKHSAVVEGDLVLGGLMMVHEREDSVTCGPVMPQGGVQALEAMLYTLDRLNQEEIIPGVKIGAHILDDCDKDTYGLEMAVDFIKGSISNIDGAEYHCNKTAVRKVISGVVGAASSVTSIQVANLLRLFRIPQVSFFSTSPELSNKQRFEYFTRTIPSDHYQVKAMVDIVRKMNWSYVSIIYEESNYGIKAFEELEELLAKYDICIAIKEKLVKDSGVAEETAYDNIVQKLLTKPRARGCIIFGSDQEVAGVMRAVRRCNATGAFSWIGSDGWSARGLVSDGNEPEVEGTLSVQPQANPVKGFEKYFLDLTVENNRRNPWFVEFWEDHFQCRYPNASWTPYNQKYTKPCTTVERLTKQNTAFEDQLQFVSDAVTAFAYAFRDMHKELCFGKPGLCDAMKPTKGTELLKFLRKVDFEGLSGDKFRFDKNGDGPARYNIIHFKQAAPGKYKWIRVGEYMEGELRLNMTEIQFRLGHPLHPESVCSLPCEVGQAKKYVEGESCCWHCFNCTQYQVRHPLDETQCIPCPKGSLPDETHSDCRDIPEEFLRPESGWAIGAMSFSATGILVTLFVGGVFLRHNDTPVVRASGRELSYVLLTGILLCYLVTFALVLRPNNLVCGIQRFGAGFCFTVVYAALLTKTNRIARIFNAGKQSAKRPSFISPRSQLIICSGLMGIQVLVNGVWMIIDPAKAMYHYPTREDNLLVCNSYIDASYMIAFSYPIILIVVCTVYAVLTRKIPEAFNESKHIGFTMYTTCVIWLAFVPLYFGTGNHVALRITSMSVTISLSASVTIACLFSPKLYIILIRPERNVRQSMMPARYSTTKSSAVTGTNASSMMAAVTLTAATCDQNKAVKRHVITTIDCSTQSEHYEMETKEDRINGKTPVNFISRSTQTQVSGGESESNPPTRDGTAIINAKDNTTSKEIVKDSSNTLQGKQQVNNVRIGNGPVSQKDGAL